MALVNNLPHGILLNILKLAVGHDNVETKLRNSHPLLAVCHSWRSLAIPFFYNQVYFHESKLHIRSIRESPYQVYACSNIDLIVKNRLCRHVKQFSLRIRQSDYLYVNLIHIASMLSMASKLHAFNLDDYSWKGLADIYVHYEEDYGGFFLTKKIASLFISTFPNLQYFDFYVERDSNVLTDFLNEVYHSYSRSLVGFKYRGCSQLPMMFGGGVSLNQLEHVDLLFYDVGEYEYMTISPCRIQSLKLSLCLKPILFGAIPECTSDEYDTLFRRLFSKGNNEVKFRHTENITLCFTSTSADSPKMHLKCKLECPSIRSMAIKNVIIGLDNIERQLELGLQKLDYKGDFADVIELSKLQLGSLKVLMVEFDNGIEEPDFIRQTNDLFAKAQGIPAVYCRLPNEVNPANANNLYWPHLTHLDIYLNTSFETAINLATRMPHLAVYRLRLKQMSDLEAKDAGAFLNSLDKPLDLSLITLFALSMEYQLNAKLFVPALKHLNQLWPRLRYAYYCASDNAKLYLNQEFKF